MERLKEMIKENKKLVIFWGIMIIAIIVILINSDNSEDTKSKKAEVNETNTYVQTQAIVEKKAEEKKEKTEIILSQSSVVLSVGSSETLKIKEGTSRKLTWTSSDPNIASVSSDGTVTAVAMGTAIVSGETSDGGVGNCTIIVTDSSAVNIKQKTNAQTTNTSNSTQSTTYTTNGDTYEPTTTYTYEDNQNDYNNNYNEPVIDNSITEEPVVEEPIEEVIKYTVTFVVDGKTTNTIKVEEGKKIEEFPSNPNKYGYTFKGWYYENEKITSNTEIKGDITVQAKWDEYTFELVLIEEDETSPNRLVVAYKNGSKVAINAIYGNYGENKEYKLGTWSDSLDSVKVVSVKQVEQSKNYMIELSNGQKVYADAK